MCPYERWVDSEYRILISGNANYRRLPVYRNTGQLLNSEQLILTTDTQLNICSIARLLTLPIICGLNLHRHWVHMGAIMKSAANCCSILNAGNW